MLICNKNNSVNDSEPSSRLCHYLVRADMVAIIRRLAVRHTRRDQLTVVCYQFVSRSVVLADDDDFLAMRTVFDECLCSECYAGAKEHNESKVFEHHFFTGNSGWLVSPI